MNKKINKLIFLTGFFSAIIAQVPIKIEKEWKGYYCGLVSPAKMAVSTEEEWENIWKQMHSFELAMPEIPKIDFGRLMVLAVFMGKQRSGGYEISISEVIKTQDNISAEIVEKEPSPDSLTTMALSSPYHVVVIKKYALPVDFRTRH